MQPFQGLETKDFAAKICLSITQSRKTLKTFFTFQLKTYNRYYLITLLTKYYTLLLQQYYLERKTTSTSWPQGTGNTNIALHVTTWKTKIAQKLHVTANLLLLKEEKKKEKRLLEGDLVVLRLITKIRIFLIKQFSCVHAAMFHWR